MTRGHLQLNLTRRNSQGNSDDVWHCASPFGAERISCCNGAGSADGNGCSRRSRSAGALQDRGSYRIARGSPSCLPHGCRVAPHHGRRRSRCATDGRSRYRFLWRVPPGLAFSDRVESFVAAARCWVKRQSGWTLHEYRNCSRDRRAAPSVSAVKRGRGRSARPGHSTTRSNMRRGTARTSCARS